MARLGKKILNWKSLENEKTNMATDKRKKPDYLIFSLYSQK